MKDIILSPIPFDELAEMIEKIVGKAVDGIGSNQSEVDEMPLMRAISKYGVTRQTFYNLHNQGLITLLKLKGRTFIRCSDISKAMQEMKRKMMEKKMKKMKKKWGKDHH